MSTEYKIVSLTTLKRKVRQLRNNGKVIGFTNGCFDLIHTGHICYLETAAKNVDVLILGLNSDKSVRVIKGRNRPIIKQEARARIMAALEVIDFVVLFADKTPYHLILSLKPDVIFKGSDWKESEIVGADIVKANGGKVKLIKYVPNNSSTNIIATVLKKCKA